MIRNHLKGIPEVSEPGVDSQEHERSPRVNNLPAWQHTTNGRRPVSFRQSTKGYLVRLDGGRPEASTFRISTGWKNLLDIASPPLSPRCPPAENNVTNT